MGTTSRVRAIAEDLISRLHLERRQKSGALDAEEKEWLVISDQEFDAFKRDLVHQGEVQGRAYGEAVGRAKALLSVLSTRGLSVSAEQREHILDCHDESALDRFLVRAVSAASTEDVLS